MKTRYAGDYMIIGMIILAVVLGIAAAFGNVAHAQPLQNARLTPGVVRTDISANQVCKIKWGKDARAVTAAMKKQVFVEYGFPKLNKDPRCPCEIDHLVSRELLGADDVKNLWVQSYSGPWNAHMKDRLENRLHAEVCAGRMSLAEAQREIRTDWRGPFVRYFGQPK